MFCIILYLHKSHNTPLLPPKILHNNFLQFILRHEDVPREISNNAYANLWVVKEVYFRICASRELANYLGISKDE